MWQLGGKACGFVISFAGGIALARLLEPDDFGLWALAFFCAKFARQAAVSGIIQGIVQTRDLEPGTRDAAFLIVLGVGTITGGAVYLSAPGLAALWNNDRLADCVRILAFSVPLMAVWAVPQALLQRNMRFRAINVVSLTSSLVEVVCSTTLAALHYGVHSLLMGTLAGVLTSTVATCVAARYRPGKPFFGAVGPLLKFAVPVAASHLLRLVASDADYIIIGRRLSAAQVGLYRRAYGSTTAAIGAVVSPLQDVLFSAFSRLQADDDRLRHAYSRALCALGIVALPTIAILFVAAPEYIPLVYGAKWQASVIPTQVLCLAMVFMTLAEPSSSLLRGVGKAGTEMACQAAYMVLLCTGAWVGTRWGIVGVAAGVGGAVCIYGCMTCWQASRAAGLKSVALARTLSPPLFSLFAVVAVSGGVREWLVAGNLGAWWVLLCTVMAGTLAHILVVLYAPLPEGRAVLRDMVGELRAKLKPRHSLP